MSLDSEILAEMERLEAQQINVGVYTTAVTVDQLTSSLKVDGDEVRLALDALEQEGQVIAWQQGKYRSRIAEAVRILRFVRQRFAPNDWQNRPMLTADVRVAFRRRMRPDRMAFPTVEAIPIEVPDSLRTSFLQAIGFPTLSRFQGGATRDIFACAAHENEHDEAFIVAGDTGAGKTEAFLFPILLSVASEDAELRCQPGVRAVLIYPRVRLAANQLQRILRYVTRLSENGGPRITVGIQNGEVPSNLAAITELAQQAPSPWARISGGFYVGLIEQCLECSAGRYTVAENDPSVDDGFPVLTCESCGHRIDHLAITQSALQSVAPDILVITHISLSQWLTREKYSHLWGLWSGGTITVPPRFLVLDEVHLYDKIIGAHLARLIRRFRARVRLAYNGHSDTARRPIIIGVSATLNDERRFFAKILDVAPDSPDYGRIRVIKPQAADMIATDGREHYLFVFPRRRAPTRNNSEYRVNPMTAAIQTVMSLVHNLSDDSGNWRALAFFDSINDVRQFESDYSAPPDGANSRRLWNLRTTRATWCGAQCRQRNQNGSLFQCPQFAAGECWVFARLFGCDRPLRVARAMYAGAIPDIAGSDLVPTTSSLEVGYDDDAIQMVYQHKSPPSAASFIQRRGRAGRDPDASPTIATLLSPYQAADVFYYLHPEALYAPQFDDAPLNAANFNVQRTHALLAFFDLVAVFRRQDLGNICSVEGSRDYTASLSQPLIPGSEALHSYRELPDQYRPGQSYFRLNLGNGQEATISGRPVSEGWVTEVNGRLQMPALIALSKGMTERILLPLWQALQENNLFEKYLTLGGIVTTSFRTHTSYPFRSQGGTGLPEAFISQFGHRDWHPSSSWRDHWLETYRHIDWMLQGKDAATTLVIHYPNPQGGDEQKAEALTFALTEFLPGKVSFRLRENRIHWTPLPPKGNSSFLYPVEKNEQTGEESILPEYLPESRDLASRPDSILGIPKSLERQFPRLPFLQLKRLRVEEFGTPNAPFSDVWHYDPTQECAVAVPVGATPPAGAFPISRRSKASSNAIVIPHIVGTRGTVRRNRSYPLDQLFDCIEGHMDEGGALLGYTVVHYEMAVSVVGQQQGQQVFLVRNFYAPTPPRDAADEPQPTLVGYTVETQGMRFTLNPDILAEARDRVKQDDRLCLKLRRQFALYRLGLDGMVLHKYLEDYLRRAAVVIDYWLHEVVPSSNVQPRLLSADDGAALLAYVSRYRNVVPTEAAGVQALFADPEFLATANDALRDAFTTSEAFNEFVGSILIHSLCTLLKRLVAQLGGVSADDLVAYADMPLMDNVDQATVPRVLVMDTVEGGSGAIAQAFERLGAGAGEGSLGWLLLREMGSCPVANEEALLRTVLERASEDDIRQVQQERTIAVLNELLNRLQLVPDPDALRGLANTLFYEVLVGTDSVNPAFVVREVLEAHRELSSAVPCGMPPEAAICWLVANLDPSRQPYMSEWRGVLARNGTSAEADQELRQQLIALYETACPDGCPVCLGEGSDIEHYHLAHLLNSRQVLYKLRDVLLARQQKGTSLAQAEALLVDTEPVEIPANPGTLASDRDTPLGVAVVPITDQTGQITTTSAVPVDPSLLEAFFTDQSEWQARYGGEQFRTYETKSGARVRSQGEQIIADWLTDNNIFFQYETRLPYRKDNQQREIHPDFFLWEHNTYIEYWGMDSSEYIEGREFKEQVYQQRNTVPINVEKDEVFNGVFAEKIREYLKI